MPNHFTRRAKVLLISFILFSTLETKASDYQSPRTAALGGAGHASPLFSDAIYLNPSYTSFIQVHALSASYLKYDGTIDTPDGSSDYRGHNLNVSILDGTPGSLFQAGVGYTRREDSSFIHVGASKSIIQKIGIGLGAKFIFPNDSSGQRFNDGTFSTSGILTRWFQTAFIIDNLFEAGTSRGLYREYILGTKFNINSIFLIYIDPNFTPTLPENQPTWGYEAGMEFPFFSDFFLRLGTFKNSNIPYEARRGDGYGIGAGWIGPRLSLDYSFSRSLRPIQAYAHNVGFSLYF
jgi:hypothetical protein